MKIKVLKVISIHFLRFVILLMIPLYLSSCSPAGSPEANGLGLFSMLNMLDNSNNGDDTTPPDEATALSINTIGAGSISLSWSDPVDSDLDHLEISVDPADIATVSVNKGEGSATLSGLNTDTNYTYTIKAVDVSDNSSSGNSAMAYMPMTSTAVTFIGGDSDVNDLHTLLQDDVDSATGGYYILGKDIDMAKYGNPWTPVGDGTAFFFGSLDGGGHTLSSMTINLPAGPDYQGLFGKLDLAGSVRNITLESVNILHAGNNYTGTLVGLNRGTLSNCSASGEIHGGTRDIGGLVGRNLSGTIKNCSADVVVNDGNYIGGLVGYSSDITAKISDSHATGNVGTESGTNEFVGGLIGYHNGGTIKNSSATGNVNALNSGGGFVGSVSSGNVIGSYSTGSVTCTNYGCGGFVGNASGTISNSFSTGAVSGVDKVGGFAGLAISTVQYCYSISTVTGTASPGGFTELNVGTITSSYYNSTLAGQSDSYATGDIDLTVEGNFSGWDFTNTWAIDGAINSGYPHLQWSEE